MISSRRFHETLRNAMDGRVLDAEQLAVVSHDIASPLIVVAGPGTGKTTAIAARALKLVFTDGWDPKSILLTTFTRKAAAELRSRLLGWGIGIKETLTGTVSANEQAFLDGIDVNRFRTGTLDSLAEQILSEYRPVNVSAPVVLDEFIANGVLLRAGLFQNDMYRNQDLLDFAQVNDIQQGPQGPSIRNLLALCRQYADRAMHDLIDLDQFASVDTQHHAMATVITQYQEGLRNRGPSVVDFGLLERRLLDQINSRDLDPFVAELRAIFVDEFQDTNALQEAIYMAIARRVGGAITVVGDDDQSLYRFRGGTVELFRDVAQRTKSELPHTTPTVLYLRTNYRSTPRLVQFINNYSELDDEYQPSRMVNKPRLIAGQGGASDMPVLGLFRASAQELADDLARLIDGLFNQRSVRITGNAGPFDITVGPGGMPGDCALLGFSVREQTNWYPRRGGGEPRLPLFLRQSLSTLATPIKVFNPRGQPLDRVWEVERLCGLMLECIDPGGHHQGSVANLGPQVVETFDRWRTAAREFVASNPAPSVPTNLSDFMLAWKDRTPQAPQVVNSWPDDVPLMDLCYQLATWLPTLHEDPEKQVFLEVVARAITQSSILNSFRSRFVNQFQAQSAIEAFRNIFAPIALGDVSVDEELLVDFPRDAVNVLTIHQAKGLEFPIVVVDVSAHFKTNHPAHRRMRFPENRDQTHIIEDTIMPHSRLRHGNFRPWRDRAFDDLVRRYFVAFSRAQSLLILAGLIAGNPEGRILNVAMGWDRTGVSGWRGDLRPYSEIQDISPMTP